ncbi:MAG: class I SAM-dependent RNA methyltransferase, partial [Rubrimonas sp.]
DLARLTYDGDVVAIRRDPRQIMGGVPVTPSPGGFLQAVADAEKALVEAVREVVGDATRIADLFAGCGAFTFPLAARASVHAVEGDAAALMALDAAWRAARGLSGGLRGVTTEARDLFRRPLLADELRRFDAVVIDPPRAGAAAQTAQIAASPIERVAFVSCNPATFARDARTLVDAGFDLTWVQPIDQFRWSPHVELAAEFVRG